MYGLQREPFCNGPMTEVCPLAAGSDFGDFKQFDIAGESRSLRYFGISFECVNQTDKHHAIMNWFLLGRVRRDAFISATPRRTSLNVTQVQSCNVAA